MGMVGKIRLPCDSIPAYLVSPKATASDRGMALAKSDHVLEELENVPVHLKTTPIKPGSFIVPPVWVGIAVLAIHEFIPRSEHRGSVRKHQKTAKVLHLTLA